LVKSYSRKYETAKTPYQRAMQSKEVSKEKKQELKLFHLPN